MDDSNKKRHRVPASCLVCRKRKSKCDRTRPVCGTCKKKLIAHLCNYEDVNWTPTNTTYLPVAAPPRPSMPYGHPVNPSPLLANPLTFAPIQGGAPPPPGAPVALGIRGLTGQMLPLPGLWSMSKSQYFDVTPKQPNQAPIGSKSYDSIPKPPGEVHTPQGQSVLPHNIPPSFQSNQQNIPNFQTNYTHMQPPQHHPQPLQGSPMFQHYQPRDSVSSGFSPHSRGLELAPVEPTHTKVILPGENQLILHEEKENVALLQPHYLTNAQITPTSLSATSTVIPTGDVATHSGSMAILNPSTDLSPSATISLASSLAMRTTTLKSTGLQPFSIDELSFRLPPKRRFSQDTGPKYVSVPVGSNIIQVDANDTMECFSVASNSMLFEGSYWQKQGPISYVGLVKNDPYIKYIRNFTLQLFKSEQFSKYILVRRRKQGMIPLSKSTTANSISDSNEQPKPKPSKNSPHCDEGNGGQGDDESDVDIDDEDGLVITAILGESIGDPSVDSFPAQLPTIRGIQSLKSIYSSKGEYYSFVKESVLEILPRKRAVQEAVRKFFRYVSPFIAILEEKTFTAELDVIFNNLYHDRSDGYYSLLKIRNDNQLCVIGQLLIITRLGYMTLISNNENEVPYTAREQELIMDITRFKSDQYISVVNLCIAEEKIQTKSTFKFVQGLTLLYFYRSVAPNDCHGLSGSDSQLLFGAIVTHALSIGLNRDPSNYSEINSVSKTPAFVNQWRILWHYICAMDALQAIYCGTPLKIPSMDIADVQRPDLSLVNPENSKFFEQMYAVVDSYRRIVSKVTNLRKKPKVIEVLQETSELENLFLEMFGTNFFRDYVSKPGVEQNDVSDVFDEEKHEESYTKVLRCICFMQMRANLSCLYYLIALHYERQIGQDNNVSISPGIELFKIFSKSVTELTSIMSYALDNSQELFGRSYDYLITSRIEKSMIKTYNFTTSFFLRLVNYKRTLTVQEAIRNQTNQQFESEEIREEFSARCDAVDSLYTISLIEAESFVGNFKVLSKTYINSYKLYVMAYFVLKQCMENPLKPFSETGNSKKYFHQGANLLQFLSVSELQSIYMMFEGYRVAKLELMRRQSTRSKDLKANILHSSKTAGAYDMKTPSGATDADTLNAMMESTVDILSSFDVTTANREMYANAKTINTYGLLLEVHKHSNFQTEVFDEQSMIANEELLKLFELYGDIDPMF